MSLGWQRSLSTEARRSSRTLLCGILPSRLPVATLPHIGPPLLYFALPLRFAPLVILPPPQPSARLPDPRVHPEAYLLVIQPRRYIYIYRMYIILNNPCMPLRCIMTDVDSKRGERKSEQLRSIGCSAPGKTSLGRGTLWNIGEKIYNTIENFRLAPRVPLNIWQFT